MKLTDVIAKKIVNDKIPVLEAMAHLQEISLYSENELKPYFADYGIELFLFNIISINIPENDISLNEIKKAKNLSARLKIAGKENYSLERSFDVMDKAAANESGTGAAFVNAGLGLGASLNIGRQIGENIMGSNDMVPPPITNVFYFLAIDGKQQGPYTEQQIREAVLQDSTLLNVLAWKRGMPTWQKLSTFHEFQNISDAGNCPPPIPE